LSFFMAPPTSHTYTLSLHDALPIFHESFVQKAIARGGGTRAHGFRIEADAVLVERLRRHAVMILRQQVGDGPAEVPEKTVARFRAFHNSSGEDRQIRSRIVVTASLKLGDHVLGPVLDACFPTVHQEIAEALSKVRTESTGNH